MSYWHGQDRPACSSICLNCYHQPFITSGVWQLGRLAGLLTVSINTFKQRPSLVIPTRHSTLTPCVESKSFTCKCPLKARRHCSPLLSVAHAELRGSRPLSAKSTRLILYSINCVCFSTAKNQCRNSIKPFTIDATWLVHASSSIELIAT